jgi:hypothetical protein
VQGCCHRDGIDAIAVENDHPKKLLILHIIHANKTFTAIMITRVCAHTNIHDNDEVDKLAKLGALKPIILGTPFHPTPLNSIQHSRNRALPLELNPT